MNDQYSDYVNYQKDQIRRLKYENEALDRQKDFLTKENRSLEDQLKRYKKANFALVDQQHQHEKILERYQQLFSKQDEQITEQAQQIQQYKQQISQQQKIIEQNEHYAVQQEIIDDARDAVESYSSVLIELSNLAKKGDIKKLQEKIDDAWEDTLFLSLGLGTI